AWFGLLLLAFGCGSDRMGADAGASAPPRSAVDREPAATSSESADGGDAGGAPEPVSDGPMDCAGSAVTTPKRVVRLTEHQLWNAYADLFGAAAAATITANEEAPSPDDRQFPPIGGDVGVSESLFALSDRLAQAAMRYVFENAATFSNCGAPPSDAACVKQELLSFAERAFRHPLD